MQPAKGEEVGVSSGTPLVSRSLLALQAIMRYGHFMHALLLVVFLSLSPSLTHSERTVIGLLRPDGITIPFAVYDEGRFSNPWKKPEAWGPKDPNSVTDLPAPWFSSFTSPTDTWFAWTNSGTASARSSAPVSTDAHCSQVWGLATPALVTKAPDNAYAATKTAFAANRKLDVAPFLPLVTDGAEAKGLIALLGPMMDRNEDKALKSTKKEDWAANELKKAKSVSVPVSLALVKVANILGRKLYYVEATRKYPRAPGSADAACSIITFQKPGFSTAASSVRITKRPTAT